jgi:hypothetical protein
MTIKETIINTIETFSEEELAYLKETTDFILFKRINSLSTTKENLQKIIQNKGFKGFEDLISHIKKVQFNRSSFDYILGHNLINWLKINLDSTQEQAKDIIKLSVMMGLLQDSGLGNYK